MRKVIAIVLMLMPLCVTALPQTQKPGDDQPVRISTELVQIDVVVADKQGRVVKGLGKDDFEVYENGKKQLGSFFEVVDAVRGARPRRKSAVVPEHAPFPEHTLSPQAPSESDIRRI